MKKIRVETMIPVLYFIEGKSFIAYSPAVDLSSCGRTRDEAKKNFQEAYNIFIEECISMGTLTEVLESCGWVKRNKKSWLPPAYVGEESMSVPLNAVV